MNKVFKLKQFNGRIANEDKIERNIRWWIKIKYFFLKKKYLNKDRGYLIYAIINQVFFIFQLLVYKV